MTVLVRKHKPTSPGRRGLVTVRETELHKGKPHAKLVVTKGHTSSGRNNKGRITVWHRGGR